MSKFKIAIGLSAMLALVSIAKPGFALDSSTNSVTLDSGILGASYTKEPLSAGSQSILTRFAQGKEEAGIGIGAGVRYVASGATGLGALTSDINGTHTWVGGATQDWALANVAICVNQLADDGSRHGSLAGDLVSLDQTTAAFTSVTANNDYCNNFSSSPQTALKTNGVNLADQATPIYQEVDFQIASGTSAAGGGKLTVTGTSGTAFRMTPGGATGTVDMLDVDIDQTLELNTAANGSKSHVITASHLGGATSSFTTVAAKHEWTSGANDGKDMTHDLTISQTVADSGSIPAMTMAFDQVSPVSAVALAAGGQDASDSYSLANGNMPPGYK